MTAGCPFCVRLPSGATKHVHGIPLFDEDTAWSLSGVLNPELELRGFAELQVWPSRLHPGFVHHEIFSTELSYKESSRRPIRASGFRHILDYYKIRDVAALSWIGQPSVRTDVPPEPTEKLVVPEPEPVVEPLPIPEPEPEPAPGTPGTIYFLQSTIGGPIKIGFTSRGTPARLREIQPVYPYELAVLLALPGPPEFERELHVRFRPCRLRGEWFEVTDDLVTFITENGGKAPGRSWS